MKRGPRRLQHGHSNQAGPEKTSGGACGSMCFNMKNKKEKRKVCETGQRGKKSLKRFW